MQIITKMPAGITVTRFYRFEADRNEWACYEQEHGESRWHEVPLTDRGNGPDSPPAEWKKFCDSQQVVRQTGVS
jgi:hypothetical protein